MRDVQIIRGAVKAIPTIPVHTDTRGRIYDDLWPLNIAGRYCSNYAWLVAHHLRPLYPNGWNAHDSMILTTSRYPYSGRWHRDAPPYEEDTIVLLCLDGWDELEWCEDASAVAGTRQRPPHPQRHTFANLYPGDLLLLPASTWHRGRCSTNRITYHVRVGPKGRTMPESPPDRLPPMTLKRFVKRTLSTLSYYLLRLPEDHWLCERYKWIVPRFR
jgi:hypothetical protein